MKMTRIDNKKPPPFTCIHNGIFPIDPQIALCKLCGIFLNERRLPLTIKNTSNKYQPALEFNPHEMMIVMISQKIPYILSQETDHLNITKYINERAELLAYLRKIMTQKRLSDPDRAFCLSVMYIDIVMFIISSLNRLPNFMIKTSEIKTDLIVIACFLIAVKFSQNEVDLPSLSEFQGSLHPKYYTIVEVRKYEDMCIKILNYKLDYCTVFDFLEIMLYHGIVLISDQKEKAEFSDLERLYASVWRIIAKFIQDARFVKYPPLIIACAIIAFARELMKFQDPWPQLFAKAYLTSKEKLLPAYQAIKSLYQLKKRSLSNISVNSALKGLGLEDTSNEESKPDCSPKPDQTEEAFQRNPMLNNDLIQLTDESIIPTAFLQKMQNLNMSQRRNKPKEDITYPTQNYGSNIENSNDQNFPTHRTTMDFIRVKSIQMEDTPSFAFQRNHPSSKQSAHNHTEIDRESLNDSSTRDNTIVQNEEKPNTKEDEPAPQNATLSILRHFHNTSINKDFDIDMSAMNTCKDGTTFKRLSSLKIPKNCLRKKI